MQQICKQCGKTFTLTEAEMDFYRRKNLNLPKRCQACREKNRRQDSAPLSGNHSAGGAGQPAGSSSGTGSSPVSRFFGGRTGRPAGKGGGKGFTLAAAGIILLLVLFFGFRQNGILSGLQEPSSAGAGMQTAASLPETAVFEPSAGQVYTFRSEKLLLSHYEKHGIEMGFDSAEAYAAAANQVIHNPESLHKLEAEDGDDVYYLEATNEFVVVSTDGYIRTYFQPDSGIDYYNRQ